MLPMCKVNECCFISTPFLLCVWLMMMLLSKILNERSLVVGAAGLLLLPAPTSDFAATYFEIIASWRALTLLFLRVLVF